MVSVALLRGIRQGEVDGGNKPKIFFEFEWVVSSGEYDDSS